MRTWPRLLVTGCCWASMFTCTVVFCVSPGLVASASLRNLLGICPLPATYPWNSTESKTPEVGLACWNHPSQWAAWAKARDFPLLCVVEWRPCLDWVRVCDLTRGQAVLVSALPWHLCPGAQRYERCDSVGEHTTAKRGLATSLWHCCAGICVSGWETLSLVLREL